MEQLTELYQVSRFCQEARINDVMVHFGAVMMSAEKSRHPYPFAFVFGNRDFSLRSEWRNNNGDATGGEGCPPVTSLEIELHVDGVTLTTPASRWHAVRTQLCWRDET